MGMTRLEAEERAGKLWGEAVIGMEEAALDHGAWIIFTGPQRVNHKLDGNGHVACEHFKCKEREKTVFGPPPFPFGREPGYQSYMRETSRQGQDVTYQELILLDSGMRLRVDIRSNAYLEQSWARILMWSGRTWQEVWSIPCGQMQTKQALYVQRGPVSVDEFAKDRDELLKVARVVVDR